MSLASSSGDRLGSVPGAGAARAVPWTGASFARGKWSGIGNLGCNRHPSKKVYYQAGTRSPVLGPFALLTLESVQRFQVHSAALKENRY